MTRVSYRREITLKYIIIVHVVNAVIANPVTRVSRVSCRTNCEYNAEIKDAYCRDRNLTAVPSGCTDAVSLDLSDNRITAVSNDSFGVYTDMILLDLSYNGLRDIESYSLTGIPNLQHIYLYNNSLTIIRNETFASLTALQQIFASKNYIRTIEEFAFQELSKLQMLFMTDNKLEFLPGSLFQGCPRIRDLHFAYNKLSSLAAGVFNGLAYLKKIDLSHNRLRSLPEGLFAGLASLQELRLIGNGLTSIPSSISSASRLLKIQLQNNNISEPYELSYVLNSVEEIHLNDNPLVCKCGLEDLRLWFQEKIDRDPPFHNGNWKCLKDGKEYLIASINSTLCESTTIEETTLPAAISSTKTQHIELSDKSKYQQKKGPNYGNGAVELTPRITMTAIVCLLVKRIVE